jgi:hypothetical protein
LSLKAIVAENSLVTYLSLNYAAPPVIFIDITH